VLQEREVEKLGGRVPIALDVRVLATTNRDLRSEVAAGRFREDLYYRLNVFPLMTSPLRERRDDVLPLAMRLLTSRCQPGQRIPAVSADAAHLLLTYPWPGNVRELDNVMQRAVILANGPVIEREHIQLESPVFPGTALGLREEQGASHVQAMRVPAAANDGNAEAARTRAAEANGNAASLAGSLSAAERDLILEALRLDSGNREAVAKRLGISPRTLRYKLARLREAGIEVPAA
jgi:two-component system response regulator FlrC